MHSLVIWSFYFIAALFSILSPIFFPTMRLEYFAPALITTLYFHDKKTVLWQAFLSGLFLDLVSSNTFVGFWIFNYLATLFFISKLKRFFFSDKWQTIPLVTYFFTSVSTLLFFLMNKAMASKMIFAPLWFFSDLIIFPLFDSLYAALVFSLPIYFLFHKMPKRRRAPTAFSLKR